jgi:uncharacterized protein (TIGR02145 family)
MKKFRVLALLCLSLAGFAFLSCTDRNGNEDSEKESSGKTNDGHDVVVFNRGDLDEVLFKIDTVYITDTSFLGRMFFKNLPESKTPEPGDIINSSITKAAPYGFLYRVVEVSREGGEVTIVSVNYASIAEAVEDADIEFEIPLVYDDDEGEQQDFLAKGFFDYVKSGARIVYNTVVNIVRPIYNAVAGNWDLGGTDKSPISVNNGVVNFNGGNVKLNGKYDLFLTARIKLESYKLKYAKMSVKQDKYLNLEGNLRGTISYSKDSELASFSLPNIEFMVGPIWVYLKNEAVVKTKVDIQAQANMNANFIFKEESEYGFEYDNGFKKINRCDKDFHYDYTHSAYGSVRLGVLMGFSSMIYGTAGLELSAGPSLVLKSPVLPLSANSKTTLDSDLDINMKVKLSLLGYVNESWNFGSARISLGRIASSKTLPSASFKQSNFDLKNIANGKLSFPFEIDKSVSTLGLSIVEYGFCMEASEGECAKGQGIGLGKFGRITGSTVSFEGLVPGAYNIVTYFKSSDGKIHYVTASTLKDFVIDGYCNGTTYNAKTQFCSGTETIKDEQGNGYVYTRIGEQHWMSENLNYYVSGSKCYYDDATNCTKYGRLYDWATAMALPSSCNTNSCASRVMNPHRGICPSGWHIPSVADWDKLLRFVDGVSGTYSPYDSPTAGIHLKAKHDWYNDGYGEDTYGFSGLPGGIGYSNGSFSYRGNNGDWWSASEYNDSEAYRFDLYSNGNKAGWEDIDGNRKHDKSKLFSIRCLKD